jgi:hypothetical protein
MVDLISINIDSINKTSITVHIVTELIYLDIGYKKVIKGMDGGFKGKNTIKAMSTVNLL